MDIDEIIQKNSQELHIPPETYSRIVRLSFTQSDQDIEDLKKAIANKNSESIKVLAHRLKGVYSNLRLEKIFAPLEKIDELAKSQTDIGKSKELFVQVTEAYKETKGCFE